MRADRPNGTHDHHPRPPAESGHAGLEGKDTLFFPGCRGACVKPPRKSLRTPFPGCCGACVKPPKSLRTPIPGCLPRRVREAAQKFAHAHSRLPRRRAREATQKFAHENFRLRDYYN